MSVINSVTFKAQSLTVDTAGRLLTRLGASEYEYIPAGSNNQPLGPTGGVGDYVERILCVVTTSATSLVQMKDGAAGSQMILLPANAPIGVHTVNLGIVSVTGDWKLTTAAGVHCIAVGDFT